MVDAYGPRVPIGGGALSGKDFYKVDRAGAILARRLAKLVVLTGVARECTAKLAISPGRKSGWPQQPWIRRLLNNIQWDRHPNQPWK